MLEQAFAFIYRSAFPEADKVGFIIYKALDLTLRSLTKQSTSFETMISSAILRFTSSFFEPSQLTCSVKNTLVLDTIAPVWPT